MFIVLYCFVRGGPTILLISNYVGYDFLPIEIKSFLKEQQDFNTRIQEGFISKSFRSFLFNV